ncbi:MAG: hypothetical protein ACYCVY_03360 [Acidiferrobacteraceae bacterium]
MQQELHRNDHRSGQGLQVRGDPSVRDFLFQQTRVESEFDRQIDRLLATVCQLLGEARLFHVIIHFSSNQLTCWPNRDPCRYQIHLAPAVLSPAFVERFPPVALGAPVIPPSQLPQVLSEFKRLRFRDPNIYLRTGSVNLANGIIGMSFSCDGSHYLSFDEFRRLIRHY